MQSRTENEKELAKLIVDTLNLEDTNPEDIAPEEPLFGDGLGLDSIDALELALAIAQKHNVHLKTDDENVQQVFGTLRSLNAFIEQNVGEA